MVQLKEESFKYIPLKSIIENACTLNVLTLRGQAGLKDEFAKAAKRSLKYMHQMEQIFEDHKIPRI